MTQQQALDILRAGHNVYLTGQAGSGKTFLLNEYISFLKENKIPVAITASTGIAATHIGGMTIHSWAGINIANELSNQLISRILNNGDTVARIQRTKVLIIDEISMFHSYRLDMVNEVCKKVRENPSPFGGIQVILCGDFFQLPPVTDEGKEKSSFAYKSKAWEELDLQICYLNEQHRQLDEGFLNLLNDIRSNDISQVTIEKVMSRLNQEIFSSVSPTRLYTHNIDVDRINNQELDKLDQKEHRYEMSAKGSRKLVEILRKNCLAPEDFIVKKGASVMFVKNNFNKGYVNGTLGKVIDFSTDNYPIVETFDGKEIEATPTEWLLEDGDKILASVTQVPLRLAWAITVHKSQGMTLDAAIIDLSKSFTYGMGYVALSRVKSLEGIKLLGINQNALMVDQEIAEIDHLFRRESNRICKTLSQQK